MNDYVEAPYWCPWCLQDCYTRYTDPWLGEFCSEDCAAQKQEEEEMRNHLAAPDEEVEVD